MAYHPTVLAAELSVQRLTGQHTRINSGSTLSAAPGNTIAVKSIPRKRVLFRAPFFIFWTPDWHPLAPGTKVTPIITITSAHLLVLVDLRTRAHSDRMVLVLGSDLGLCHSVLFDSVRRTDPVWCFDGRIVPKWSGNRRDTERVSAATCPTMARCTATADTPRKRLPPSRQVRAEDRSAAVPDY